MLDENITKIFNYVKSEKFRTNLIILLSVISANFAAYISFFDLNSLAIIDSSTISKHIINLLIPYILVSVCITLAIHIGKLDMGLAKLYKVLHYRKEGIFIRVWKFYMNSFSSAVWKQGVILLLFCFLYIGTSNTLVFLLIFGCLMVFYILLYFLYSHYSKAIIKSCISKTSIEKDKLELQNIYDEKTSYKNAIIANIGIIIIAFSFFLGIARAIHVYNTTLVKINDDTNNYVLYMTTISGVGLYDWKSKEVSFKSWDSIDNIHFNIENKKSIGEFFDTISGKFLTTTNMKE